MMGLRFGTLAFATALVLVGAFLLVRSSGMAEWIDPARAEALMSVEPPAHDSSHYDAFMSRWYSQNDALRTAKWPLFDLGSGLIAFASSLAAAMLILKIRTWQNIADLKTPNRSWLILFLAVAARLGLGWSLQSSIALNQSRSFYPPWADSIAIPIFGLIVFDVVGLLLLIPLTWLMALSRAPLPINMWVWEKNTPIISWTFSACAAVSLIWGWEILREALSSGPYSGVPAVFLWTYATLAVRAAGVARWAKRASSTQTA